MAHCCISMWGGFFAVATAVLYILAYVLDWWVLTPDNRADLFFYTLATPSSTPGDSVSYTWDYICRDVACTGCTSSTSPGSTCDSRPGDISCNGVQAANWCTQMTSDACAAEWEAACRNSAIFSAFDVSADDREGCEDVADLSDLSESCRLINPLLYMVGFAMGFSVLTSVLGFFVLLATCCPNRSFLGRALALCNAALLFLEFCFGVAAFSIGFVWVDNFADTDNTPALWVCLGAFILNFFTFLFYGCVAAINHKGGSGSSSSSSSRSVGGNHAAS